jgi:hypothetical protein
MNAKNQCYQQIASERFRKFQKFLETNYTAGGVCGTMKFDALRQISTSECGHIKHDRWRVCSMNLWYDELRR